MDKHEQTLMKYFQSWIVRDASSLKEFFAKDVIYSECYGPEYHGLEVIEQWFSDWQKHGTVIAWEIKQFIHQGNRTAAEWYFKCEYDGEVSDFDGVTLAEFDQEGFIINLKEFQSKLPHYDPYEK